MFLNQAALILAGLITLNAGTASAHSFSASASIRIAPPSARMELVSRSPGAGHVWTPGYWAWNGGGYVWVAGSWQRSPGPGWVWQPAEWQHTPGGFVLIPGRWVQERPVPPTITVALPRPPVVVAPAQPRDWRAEQRHARREWRAEQRHERREWQADQRRHQARGR